MAGSIWPALTAGLRARASDVESKFDWLEGSLVPMSNGSTTDAVHDLGTTTARWNNIYCKHNINMIGGGVTSTSILMQSNAAGQRSELQLGRASVEAYVGVDIAGGDLILGSTAGALGIRTQNLPIVFSDNGGNTMTAAFSAGNFGIGAFPNSYTALDVTGTRAIRLPRLSTAQRDALTAAEGMIIYNSSTVQFQAYENGSWVSMVGARIGVQALANTSLSWNTGATGTTNWINYTGTGRIKQMQFLCSSHGGITVITGNVLADTFTIGTFAITAVGTNTAYQQPLTTTGLFFGWSTTVNTVTGLNLDTYFRTGLTVQGVVTTPPGGAVTISLLMEWEHT